MATEEIIELLNVLQDFEHIKISVEKIITGKQEFFNSQLSKWQNSFEGENLQQEIVELEKVITNFQKAFDELDILLH
jgi:hypothetical protein